MLKIIFRARKLKGKDDLEALEMLIRTGMHKIGSRLLEKFLNSEEYISPSQVEVCSDGHPMKYIEEREKEITTVVGKIRLRRKYYYDSKCGKGFVPKDCELGIDGSSLSPGVRRIIGIVGSNRSFSLSEADISELSGLQINSKAIERNCHKLGKEVESYVNQLEQDNPSESNSIMYISMDGTGVPVLKTETAGRKGKQENGESKTREVKLGCVFTQIELDKNNRPERQENSTTYVGAIESSEEFSKRLYAEAQRRGIERAKEICIIGDGAKWIWNIAEENYSYTGIFERAIQIIDLYHAREHYWDCARAVYPSYRKKQSKWAERRKRELDDGDVEAVIRAIKRLSPKNEEAEQVCKSTINYFKNNKERMRYNTFRAKGLFVGSGVIEAGCRSVIGQRLKQSGMHWSVSGANTIIALRCLIKSHRWEDFWEAKSAA